MAVLRPEKFLDVGPKCFYVFICLMLVAID